MFAKSKIAAPLVALLVACMAVQAVDVPLQHGCKCWNEDSPEGMQDITQQICTSLGQANASMDPNSGCITKTQSVYQAFTAACSASSIVVQGKQYNMAPYCTIVSAPVPAVPTSCFCETAAGANSTRTGHSCDSARIVTSAATLVADKCVITTSGAFTVFASVCSQTDVVAAPVCSSV